MKAKTKFSKTKFSRLLTPILFLLLISTAGCLNIDFVKSAANGGPLAWTYSPAENIVIVPAESHYKLRNGGMAITEDRIYAVGDEQGNARNFIFVFDHTGKQLVDETIEVLNQQRVDNSAVMKAWDQDIIDLRHDNEYIYAKVRVHVWHSYHLWWVKIDRITGNEIDRFKPWGNLDSHAMINRNPPDIETPFEIPDVIESPLDYWDTQEEYTSPRGTLIYANSIIYHWQSNTSPFTEIEVWRLQ